MQNYFDNEATTSSSSSLYATMKPARDGKSLVTLSTYEDRKEALSNTTLMNDASICRSNGPKINASQQIKQQQQQQQNGTLDSRDTKQETNSIAIIPKPPPFQLTGNGNNLHLSAPKSFLLNDQTSNQRFTNSSQNNSGDGDDTYSRPNKPLGTLNGYNGNNGSNTQANRKPLRLGTVTIGEYRHPTLRREPEKFDFLAAQKKCRSETGDTTPTNDSLQSELQNTLSRANLRKSNNNNSYTEHQRNCPLHQQQQQQLQLQQRHSGNYGNNGCYNVDELSKKLQKSTINDNNLGQLLTKTNNRLSANGTTGVGILKNGNRKTTSSSCTKSTEKSIKFG